MIRYSHRIGATAHDALNLQYSKTNDRWAPRYIKRPERYIRFISIGESVPDMEVLNLNQMVHYQKEENNDAMAILVRDTAGQILNRNYETLYRVKYVYRGKSSIGVKTPSVTYSGLSMSSGEQRVFRILDAVFRAPKYGLILVDELDLFLHHDALQRLLGSLQEHCHAKNKQLIFTTHFPPVAEMYAKMCIYSLNRIPSKTIVWQGYSYEAMRHITGKQDRPIKCYVEDDVAEQIVSRVASELAIRKFVQIGHFGPAANAFNLCAGLYLSAQSTAHTLAILDGDVYGLRSERRERVNAAITGNQSIHATQRSELMRMIRALAPMKNASGLLLSPEQVLHRMLHSLAAAEIPSDRSELHNISLGVVNVPERHGFLNKIIEITGESREIALSRIMELAALSGDWIRYTRVVRAWLAKQKVTLGL